MATIANLIIDQGTTFSTQITPTRSDGTLLDLDNFSPTGLIRKTETSSLAGTFTCSRTENSPNQDTVTISLTSTQTKEIKPGRYMYDVIVKNNTSPVTEYRILEGQVEFTPSISSAATANILNGIGADSPSA